MSLLGWPRRSLLSIKVAVGVTLGNNANTPIIHVSITSDVVAIPVVLTLRYFCAYSALCMRGNGTWGVAPGYKLLRFQRVLLASHSYNGWNGRNHSRDHRERRKGRPLDF